MCKKFHTEFRVHKDNKFNKGNHKMTLKVDPAAKALIFDIDGTLADTMPVHYRAWGKICLEYNIVFPEKLFYEFAGIPTKKIVLILNERFGYNLDPVGITQLKENVLFYFFVSFNFRFLSYILRSALLINSLIFLAGPWAMP